jgi:hypothetical protein
VLHERRFSRGHVRFPGEAAPQLAGDEGLRRLVADPFARSFPPNRKILVQSGV